MRGYISITVLYMEPIQRNAHSHLLLHLLDAFFVINLNVQTHNCHCTMKPVTLLHDQTNKGKAWSHKQTLEMVVKTALRRYNIVDSEVDEVCPVSFMSPLGRVFAIELMDFCMLI